MKRICLGKITGAHGIKGLVKIMPFGEDPYLIDDLSPVFTAAEGDKTLAVTLKNPQGSHFLAEVEGVTDRTGAENLKGTEIYVPRDALPDIEEDGAYYIEDLIGMIARDEAGQDVGTVLGVHNFGAGDLLEIRLSSGESFMMPFTDDTVGDIQDYIPIRNYEDYLA
ncbi:MAG: ribosome maturation factor RimM [Alphaproteobacteria bacterium]|nr:ribosome maturation factor RimM [Alphaproteobacteria bacterium]MCD8526296.1 ribosome maturation factor RimM [Alphaproteobacteria bacterium]MCD8569927.1 ribosome maturation factor RimM [Alphaproteobacteria bacterium]